MQSAFFNLPVHHSYIRDKELYLCKLPGKLTDVVNYEVCATWRNFIEQLLASVFIIVYSQFTSILRPSVNCLKPRDKLSFLCCGKFRVSRLLDEAVANLLLNYLRIVAPFSPCVKKENVSYPIRTQLRQKVKTLLQPTGKLPFENYCAHTIPKSQVINSYHSSGEFCLRKVFLRISLYRDRNTPSDSKFFVNSPYDVKYSVHQIVLSTKTKRCEPSFENSMREFVFMSAKSAEVDWKNRPLHEECSNLNHIVGLSLVIDNNNEQENSSLVNIRNITECSIGNSCCPWEYNLLNLRGSLVSWKHGADRRLSGAFTGRINLQYFPPSLSASTTSMDNDGFQPGL